MIVEVVKENLFSGCCCFWFFKCLKCFGKLNFMMMEDDDEEDGEIVV